MKNQALFSLKAKSKKLKCCLLQFLFGALRVKSRPHVKELHHPMKSNQQIVQVNISFYFIPSCEFNAYLKQIKVILSAVKRYRILSLVTNTIYIFSL